MYHSFRFISVLSLFFCVAVLSCAQKVREVSGEYVYYPPENISLEQAKIMAVERARLDAITRAFGANVSQINSVAVSTHNGESDTDFQSLGTTEVNGDWLADTKAPEYAIVYEGDMLVIKVKVWGKVRERKRANSELSIATLCNGIESEKFKNKDRFSVRFCSPVKGFLSIWLADDNLHQVYCLLPYENSNGVAREIQGRKTCTLLSTADSQYPYREETILTTERESEFNRLVFVFSPNRFTMPLTEQGAYLPELSVHDFDKWLQRNRIKDEDMYVIQRMIEIKK